MKVLTGPGVVVVMRKCPWVAANVRHGRCRRRSIHCRCGDRMSTGHLRRRVQPAARDRTRRRRAADDAIHPPDHVAVTRDELLSAGHRQRCRPRLDLQSWTGAGQVYRVRASDSVGHNCYLGIPLPGRLRRKCNFNDATLCYRKRHRTVIDLGKVRGVESGNDDARDMQCRGSCVPQRRVTHKIPPICQIALEANAGSIEGHDR